MRGRQMGTSEFVPKMYLCSARLVVYCELDVRMYLEQSASLQQRPAAWFTGALEKCRPENTSLRDKTPKSLSSSYHSRQALASARAGRGDAAPSGVRAMEDSKVSQRNSSRYEMGQTTRSEWESDMRAHRELLRNVIEEHREGRDSAVNMSEMLDDLALPEEIVYAPISTLASSNPPMMAQGPSGWIYHSTSLFCLRPHHFPRRVAINIVESAPFDPFILITIMCNCFTMAWASPMDEPGTWKQDVLAVRASARAQTSANKGPRAGQGRADAALGAAPGLYFANISRFDYASTLSCPTEP